MLNYLYNSIIELRKQYMNELNKIIDKTTEFINASNYLVRGIQTDFNNLKILEGNSSTPDIDRDKLEYEKAKIINKFFHPDTLNHLNTILKADQNTYTHDALIKAGNAVKHYIEYQHKYNSFIEYYNQLESYNKILDKVSYDFNKQFNAIDNVDESGDTESEAEILEGTQTKAIIGKKKFYI